jgi:hypothetical protein
VSLRIAGDAVEEARIREFSTRKLVYTAPDVSFDTKVENVGNVFVRPHGLVEITNMFGTKVGTVAVNDGGAPVFPGEHRVYTVDWKSDSFAIGRYQAVVSLSYGDDLKKTITATASFWIVPLKFIAIVAFSLLVVILALYLGMRTYIRRTLRSMGVNDTQSADTKRSGSSRLPVVILAVILLVIMLGAVAFLLAA